MDPEKILPLRGLSSQEEVGNLNGFYWMMTMACNSTICNRSTKFSSCRSMACRFKWLFVNASRRTMWHVYYLGERCIMWEWTLSHLILQVTMDFSERMTMTWNSTISNRSMKLNSCRSTAADPIRNTGMECNNSFCHAVKDSILLHLTIR